MSLLSAIQKNDERNILLSCLVFFRVDDWFLMSSPLPTMLICSVYVMMVSFALRLCPKHYGGVINDVMQISIFLNHPS